MIEQTEDQIISIILEESKKIQDVLNNDFLKKFAQLHNIPEEYNRFSAKQEVVAKRAYFLSVKKKYALFIVNSEGVPVNEYNIRGLITRRSDYPSLTKKRIMELLDLLLKVEKVSFKNIREFVKKTEEEFHNLCISGDKTIARPVTFSKDEKNYKRIPPQILGMQLWNVLEYEYFVQGTKGYQFKISGIDPYLAPTKVKQKLEKIDFNKYNNIVLPYEETKLPEYFKLKVDDMMNFSWTDRVKELLEPIWDKIDKSSKLKIMTF